MSTMETKNPGEILRSTREQQGLSLNDVSLATKINPRILKALEEGNLDALPPKSFTRGFIRSYSNYLKINADPIVEAFNMTDTVVVPNPGEGATAPTPKGNTSPNITNYSRSLLVTGIVVLLVMIFGIKQIIEKYSKERIVDEPVAVESIKPEAETKDEAATETSAATATAPATDKPADIAAQTETAKDGKTETAGATSATETKTDATAKSKTDATTPAVAATNTPPTQAAPTTNAPTAENKTTTAPVTDTKTAAAPMTETKPATTTTAETKPADKKIAEPKPAALQELMVEALDKVELVIKTEEGTKKVQLAPESVHTIKTRGNITLEISDGGTVNLVHNGRDKGIPGDLGKPKTVTFP